MRHRVKGKKLNRTVSHRRALFRNLVASLIEKGEVKTTEAKAKAIKGVVDKLLVQAKAGTVHARRVVGGFLQRRLLVNKLVDKIVPSLGNRTSGFTRIVRLGKRRGDDAMMVKMELVDYKEKDQVKEKKTGKVEGKKISKKEDKSGKRSGPGVRPDKKEAAKSQVKGGRVVDAASQLRGER